MAAALVFMESADEVLAVHRMLMEYKFDDLSSEYAGSPYVAAFQHRLADALEGRDPGSGLARVASR